MAWQEIILGTPPTGLGGDPPRVASQKINLMTKELYDKNTALGTAATVTAQTKPKASAGEALLAQFNGIGLQNDLRNTLYITGTPLDLASSGTCIGFADGSALGIPGAHSAGCYGVLNSSVHWGGPSGAPGMQQEFSGNYDGQPVLVFRRAAINDISWTSWVQISAPIVGSMGNATSPGAVFEYGNNSSGEFTRFADGTVLVSAVGVTPSIGANTFVAVNISLPTSLVINGAEFVSATVSPSKDNDQYGAIGAYLISPAQAVIVVRNGNVAQTFGVRVFVKGRWK